MHARQSTAKTFIVGPVLDADGVAVTDAVVGDFKVSKNGAAAAALNGSTTATHDAGGRYRLACAAGDFDTVGTAQFVLDDSGTPTNTMQPKDFDVIEEAVYDLWYASGAPANATLTLTQLNVVNTAGHAVVLTSSGSNGRGLSVTGNGSGAAAVFQGGATGHGLHALGGATSGNGALFQATSGGSGGHGLSLIGVSVNSGLSAVGGTNGHGIYANGGTNGDGMHLDGGANGDDLFLAASIAPTLMTAFFTNDSGEDYAGAVAGSVVKEIADNSIGGGAGTGSTVVDANLIQIDGVDLVDAVLNLKKLNVVNPDIAGVAVNFQASGIIGQALTVTSVGLPGATFSGTGGMTITSADGNALVITTTAGGGNPVLINANNAAGVAVGGGGNNPGVQLAGGSGGSTGHGIYLQRGHANAQDVFLATPASASLASVLAGAGAIDGFNLEQTLRLCLAALAGKISGAGTTTITIRSADDDKDRIVATVDSNGNRTAVTLDATA